MGERNLSRPVTVGDEYQAAILGELEAIRELLEGAMRGRPEEKVAPAPEKKRTGWKKRK